jgi:hypothetical protein
VIETVGHLLRQAADFLAPVPPRPPGRVVISVTRSRVRMIDAVEWLPDSLDHDELEPPIREYPMGLGDELDLSHDVHGYDSEGQRVTVSHAYHVSLGVREI